MSVTALRGHWALAHAKTYKNGSFGQCRGVGRLISSNSDTFANQGEAATTDAPH